MIAGTLREERRVLIVKHQDGSDEEFFAPPGTPIQWHGGTNQGHESSYGDRFIFWVVALTDSGVHGIGVEPHEVDWQVSL